MATIDRTESEGRQRQQQQREQKKRVAVVGAGLVGSLNACYLAQKDLDVHVFEYRGDIRTMEHVQGRSINLALSERGRAALRHVAMETAVVSSHGIPMYARMIHDVNGRTRKIPYGKANQCIYSVGRRYLNETLITEAEKYNNVHFHFNHKLQHCDLENGELTFANGVNEHFDLILGCDGAYSSVRRQMMKLPRFNYSQHYIEHGYMELCIPPMANGEFAMEPNYLHIWPRGRFMMIALPNQDQSWTVTLFMPFATYETLTTTDKLMAFFEANYRDSIELIGREKLVQDFFSNTLLPMVSIKCSPYHVTDKALIMGDAAHAMVPFYGQGMNAGFEDCLILHEMMTSHSMKLDRVLSEYSEYRQPDAEAICDLAMYNYIEMRDLVNSRAFLLRKYLDNVLNSVLSSLWTPLYTMVAFTRIRYHEAIAKKRQQDSIVRSLLFLIPGFAVALAVLNYHQTESGFFSMNDDLIKLFRNNFQLFQTNVK